MNLYCSLAKQAVEKYIKEEKVLGSLKKLPAEFKKRAGIFVTIYNNKDLRGCIGTFHGTKPNLAEEIIDNAIMAATRDWRFESITKEELSRLSYEVSVLEKPEQIKDIEELDPEKYGIIVKEQSSGRSALLLPELEGLDTIEKQLDACYMKSGIDPGAKQVVIHKFKTTKYKS